MISEKLLLILLFSSKIVAKPKNLNNFNEFNLSNDWTFNQKTNKYYKVFSGFNVDFNESEFICQTYFGIKYSMNSSLVKLDSWAEQKFVYSLALMSLRDQIQGENLWVGAVEKDDKIKWIYDSSESVSKEKEYFENLFDEQNCFMCNSRPDRCALLDLTRGPNQDSSSSNRWKFNDCDNKYGFICQLSDK